MKRQYFGNPPRQGERGLWVAMSCYLPHATPPLLPPTSPLPTPRICRTACGHVIRISWRETPPPHPHTPHCRIIAVFSDLGQNRGRPLFRSSDRTLRSRDSFWLFHRKWWKFRRAQKICQSAAISTSRAGTTAGTVRERRAHISWAAWVLRSLEVYMHERRHHLNESSSARLGGSQRLEILPSPNSKQTQSFDA
jgi:hypothetical protein